jgi:hypothetical protein
MRTKSDGEKISIKKMIREKQITIIKIRTKVDIKIKLNQILRDEIEKKKIQNKIYSNQKFEDQI